jgi:hypothetical protein
MKVLVEGHVPAWCYVDTETGVVELIEVWAWEEELTVPRNAHVMAEDAGDEERLERELITHARTVALERADMCPFSVMRDQAYTMLEVRAGARARASSESHA